MQPPTHLEMFLKMLCFTFVEGDMWAELGCTRKEEAAASQVQFPQTEGNQAPNIPGEQLVEEVCLFVGLV